MTHRTPQDIGDVFPVAIIEPFTAYAWVFYPDVSGGLTALNLPPAVKDETIVARAADRLSDQNYGQVKVLEKMGAVYFNAKVTPHLWKDQDAPLDLQEAARRFLQWTYLPILPDRERTLTAAIREGVQQKLWAVAIGDPGSDTYQQLVETTDELDTVSTLFDGSACLVTGAYLDLIREQIGKPAQRRAEPEPKSTPNVTPDEQESTKPPVPPIPRPAQRYARVRLRLDSLGIGKTNNLQPYLFKVLQEQDAAAELSVTIAVTSSAGISEDALERRIVEGLDQLGIAVSWEPE